MGMLGVYKVNLDIGVPQMQMLFVGLGLVEKPVGGRRFRFGRTLHTRQLAIPIDFSWSDLLKGSSFGLVYWSTATSQMIML